MLKSIARLTTHYVGKEPTIQRCATRSFHKDYDAAREEQTLELEDGRTMGFAEYGKSDGTPAIFLHGSPGSRYDGKVLLKTATKLGLRIICPDRPGYGLSTLNPNLVLAEYPNDISQLAKHLNIPKYRVIGISGGGPYTVACAFKLPRDQLLNAAVIAGGGPPEVLTLREAGLYSTIIAQLTKRAPGVLRYLAEKALAQDKSMESQMASLEKWFFTKKDRELLVNETEEDRAGYVAAFKEAYAQSAEGAIQDAVVQVTPWTFELRDVPNKVQLFYGHRDTRTPLVWGRHMKQHIPDSELYEYEDDSHFTILRHDEEILRKIFGVEASIDSPSVDQRPPCPPPP